MLRETGTRVAALVLLIAVAGCGGGPRLVKVSGRVTYHGQPVPSTRVTFVPDDGGRPSRGLTDDTGQFTLKFTRTEMGALRGAHAVFLRYEVGNDEELKKTPPKASEDLKDVISRYGDPQTSNLHYQITKNGQFIEIKLDQ